MRKSDVVFIDVEALEIAPLHSAFLPLAPFLQRYMVLHKHPFQITPRSSDLKDAITKRARVRV